MDAKDIQFDLGVMYFKEEKYREALEIFEKIKEEKPNNLQVINMCNRASDAVNGK